MRIGSLFSGYGGLCELAVAPLLGGSVAWHSEIDPAAARILAHHWPDTPNLGDITAVDWKTVEPVAVLTGGFPCQDLSHAGKRLGLRPETRSGLWSHMAYAIAQLRPRMVVIENVRGLLSAPAHSDLEPCPWCLGDDEDGALRALGAVLGDLAGLGYDARWGGVRASDAGAPHRRFRVFIVAYPAADPGLLGWRPGWIAAPGQASRGRARSKPAGRGLLPTPRATDGTKGGPNQRGSSGDLMLPSAVALLPTPTATDYKASGSAGYGGNEFCTLTDATVRQPDRWGIYADAIARWEALTRPAPEPTQRSTKGTPQLSPAFSEWVMGLPAGHVTDPAIGISRRAQLSALGNGVVPQQAALALRYLLSGLSLGTAA